MGDGMNVCGIPSPDAPDIPVGIRAMLPLTEYLKTKGLTIAEFSNLSHDRSFGRTSVLPDTF
jgi:hypothetical protein